MKFAYRPSVDQYDELCEDLIDKDNGHITVCREVEEAYQNLILAAPRGLELAEEILRTCDPTTGRILSDITRREIEPIRKLAEAFLVQVKGLQ
jgi:hypothetical protein